MAGSSGLHQKFGETLHYSTKQVLFNDLDAFEKRSTELFEDLAKAYSNRTFKPELSRQINESVEKLVKQDRLLQENIRKAIKQLEKYKLIKQLEEEIKNADIEVLQFHAQLKEAEIVLATSLHQAKKKLSAAEQAKSSSISCEELIRFAFRISSGNSVEAPPGWMQGDPRRPYPLDIEMRCGALGALSQKVSLSSPVVHVDSKKNIFNEEPQINEDIDIKKSYSEIQESSKNGVISGLWQGPPSEDVTHLTTMPASALLSANNGPSNPEEVEFMSTSSDSSSSGESN